MVPGKYMYRYNVIKDKELNKKWLTIKEWIMIKQSYILCYQKLCIVGYRPPDTDNLSLEVRKIPKEFNNIMAINQHFSKFGNLTNIQVCWTLKPNKKKTIQRVGYFQIHKNYSMFLSLGCFFFPLFSLKINVYAKKYKWMYLRFVITIWVNF